ncbi:MAG TPA: DUF3830 family protein [Planctomycetota bacterium]|nr:DUF3830 family protein [Planctomycetota bacterium]HUV39185.1 DUF3830 family protein [Planctomycetota bacterium]
MTRIVMTFERGGEIAATLFEDRAPGTCRRVLEALPVTAEVVHAMWAGEEIFFGGFPAKFEYEHPTQQVDPGALAMVPRSSSFCIFYGRSIPRGAVDEEIDVTVFGKVDDVDAMTEIGRRVRRRGVEKVTITRQS